MTIVDIHAHLTPRFFIDAVADGRTWHNMSAGDGELHNPLNHWSVQQRLDAMDADRVDVQVVSPTDVFYQYHQDAAVTAEIARAANEAVAELRREHPQRFAGLGTVPMQATDLAIAELERAVRDLGLAGVMIDDHVNGETYDLPRFDAFFEAAAELGAVVFVHQYGPTSVAARIDRFFLFNSIGNLVDRAITFASLVYGGVMDRHPGLKVCLGHAGGYTAFALDRMDHGWRQWLNRRGACLAPPSTYASRFFYDAVTYQERTLRFLLDTVGADRVMLGTDWPAPMRVQEPVTRLTAMASITEQEAQAILHGTARHLFGKD